MHCSPSYTIPVAWGLELMEVAAAGLVSTNSHHLNGNPNTAALQGVNEVTGVEPLMMVVHQ